MKEYKFKLFITGNDYRSENTIRNLKRLCDIELKITYELKIIDLLENPQIAEEEKILATPLLIREFPEPRRRYIGDLSNIKASLLCTESIKNTHRE
ncbi:MAG: circadian clock protein KaiB [Candidatus Lokiarchaeota archaeon]|nr:circadian clock protein KaiB [Candidatus Lokiarchaeota archaeon]MBD3202453.1 circadian clock protein KaiB [Candidatus Lokiarchaeota archaeon]